MQHTAELLPLLLRLLQQWRTAVPEQGLATFLMVSAVELMRALEPANITPIHTSGQEAVKACHCVYLLFMCLSGSSQGMPLYVFSFKPRSYFNTPCIQGFDTRSSTSSTSSQLACLLTLEASQHHMRLCYKWQFGPYKMTHA
jgi:hypothetical protein